MFVQNLPQQVWLVLMLSVSAYAFLRGGAPERVVSIANILAWFLTPLVYDRQHWFAPQIGVMLVDVGFLFLLLQQALTTNRIWLLFAAAFQFLGVITHLAIVADGTVRALPYRWGLVIWSYMVLVSLAAGAWSVRGRRARAARA